MRLVFTAHSVYPANVMTRRSSTRNIVTALLLGLGFSACTFDSRELDPTFGLFDDDDLTAEEDVREGAPERFVLIAPDTSSSYTQVCARIRQRFDRPCEIVIGEGARLDFERAVRSQSHLIAAAQESIERFPGLEALPFQATERLFIAVRERSPIRGLPGLRRQRIALDEDGLDIVESLIFAMNRSEADYTGFFRNSRARNRFDALCKGEVDAVASYVDPHDLGFPPGGCAVRTLLFPTSVINRILENRPDLSRAIVDRERIRTPGGPKPPPLETVTRRLFIGVSASLAPSIKADLRRALRTPVGGEDDE